MGLRMTPYMQIGKGRDGTNPMKSGVRRHAQALTGRDAYLDATITRGPRPSCPVKRRVQLRGGRDDRPYQTNNFYRHVQIDSMRKAASLLVKIVGRLLGRSVVINLTDKNIIRVPPNFCGSCGIRRQSGRRAERDSHSSIFSESDSKSEFLFSSRQR